MQLRERNKELGMSVFCEKTCVCQKKVVILHRKNVYST